ncbi:phosphoribosylformylglycinamidine synthase-like [Catharus ustulatus]|uniref:phosphoribosylformylglycinamidine synthase-like n=1 Tax=Catharus ustulatus TaxID=91951 RepID=UPI00140E7E1A|nr:phosphoribosylformylglycinamidine synthase-like [Catharus ustulatus]
MRNSCRTRHSHSPAHRLPVLMQLLRFFVQPQTLGGVPDLGVPSGLGPPLKTAQGVEPGVTEVTCELCYYLGWAGDAPPSEEESRMLRWILGSPLAEGADVAPGAS